MILQFIPIIGIIIFFAYRLEYAIQSPKHYSILSSINTLPAPPPPQQITNKIYDASLSVNDLTWYMHVSDIHISYRDEVPGKNFERFLDVHREVKPAFVLATGDLTDAKNGKMGLTSSQHAEEWKFYRDTLNAREISPETWIDIPGNHDTFHVADEENNLYRKYGMWGSDPSKTLRTINTAIGKSPFPGLGRPMNFFGDGSKIPMDNSTAGLARDTKVEGSLKNIIICHYPLCLISSLMINRSKYFAKLSKNFSMYLCGHLHRLAFGLGDDLTAVHHRPGFAEFEVGDLQKHRAFHLFSINKRNSFSFSRHTLDNPVLLHVISPKDPRYFLEHHETHWISKDENGDLIVELLVFPVSSSVGVESLKIIIDGKYLQYIYFEETVSGLFSVSIEGTKDLALDVPHNLKVEVTMEDHSFHSVSSQFFLELRVRSPLNTIGSKILSFDFISHFDNLFWTCYFGLTCLFCFLSCQHYQLFLHKWEGRLLQLLVVLLMLTPVMPLSTGGFIHGIKEWQSMFYSGVRIYRSQGEQWIRGADFPVHCAGYWIAFVFPSTILLLSGYMLPNSNVILTAKWFFTAVGLSFLFFFHKDYSLLAFLLSLGYAWIFVLFSILNLYYHNKN